MNWTLLLSPTVLLAYLIYAYLKYGMTASISATYPRLSKPEKYLFSLTWTAYVAPIMLVTVDRWFIAAGLMLMLVAGNPNYWDKAGAQDDLHYIGAYGTILFGYTGLIIKNPLIGGIATAVFLLFTVGISVNLLFLKKVRHETYWQECAAAFSIPVILYFLS